MEPKKTGRITLSDVAREAGVSTATVSYVLGGKQGGCAISETTARRILETASTLGYKKDQAAAALSALKNANLSLIVLSPWLYAQFSDFTVRVNGVLEDSGARVQYMNFHAGQLREVLRPALCKRAHAILVMGTSVEDERFLLRNREKFPNLVLINRRAENIPSVSGNDEEATAELCRRIADGGHYERYVMLRSPSPSSCEQERMLGFMRAMPSGEDRILDRPAEDFLDEYGKGTFYFLPQYQLASRLTVIASRMGYSVPSDIGIAGYDIHSLLADYLPKPLTTVDPRTEEMAKAALKLAETVRTGGVPVSFVVSAFVVRGATTLM